MPQLTRKKITVIQHEVLSWYAANKRDLPWRRTSDPYAILVSEIMLQQTQVSRVIPKYQAFLEEFPTVQSLAAASPAAVIRAWQGLGYNRRALNLQRAARAIMDQYQDQAVFPSTPDELIKLPGLGRYTAGAVATFAFGEVAPAVDTNVRQVLDRLIPARRLRTETEYYELAQQLIPTDNPATWLHALMDYASLVIRPMAGKQRRKQSTTEPFIGSNRYVRGQIIDRLRIEPETKAVLYQRIAVPIEVDQPRFDYQLAALERDGMIERHRGRYRLPEA